jgi:hypothetical protein
VLRLALIDRGNFLPNRIEQFVHASSDGVTPGSAGGRRVHIQLDRDLDQIGLHQSCQVECGLHDRSAACSRLDGLENAAKLVDSSAESIGQAVEDEVVGVVTPEGLECGAAGADDILEP